MMISARFLDNYLDADTFDYAQQLSINTSNAIFPGATFDIYLQLIDLTKDKASQGFVPAGRRFTGGDYLQVTFSSQNIAKVCAYHAVRPTDKDASIWKVTVPAADFSKLKRGTLALYCNLTISQPARSLLFTIPNAVNIIPQGDY